MWLRSLRSPWHASFSLVLLALGCAYAVEPREDRLGLAAPGSGGGFATGSGGESALGGAPPVSSGGTAGSPSAGGAQPALGGNPGTGGEPGAGGAGGETGGAGGAPPAATGGQSTGGAQATGGAPSTEAFLCEEGATAISALKVQMKSSILDASTNQLSLIFNLVHTGAMATPVALSNTAIRYWFSADGVSSLVAECDYARAGCANVRWRIVPTSADGADHYLEVGFTSAAGSVTSGNDSGEVQLRLHHSNYQGNFTQANDYSFTALSSNFADHGTATAYHQCQLVWGTEPTAN